MQHATQPQSVSLNTERGELFSVLLRLHPVEAGWVSPSSGSQAHAAFLDIVHQNDPAIGRTIAPAKQATTIYGWSFAGIQPPACGETGGGDNKKPEGTGTPRTGVLVAYHYAGLKDIRHVHPAFDYKAWHSFIRLGEAQFEVSRLIGSPEPGSAANPWTAYSSFAELSTYTQVQRYYEFEFATPTAFSMGQQCWGKLMKLLPEPAYVFESLAKQWETFAPEHLRLAANDLTARRLATWCEESLIVARYVLETRYLPSSKFAQAGFQGKIMYEMKGMRSSPEAAWLTPLAHFALFSGVGYKTSMGMGQSRCINLAKAHNADDRVELEARS